MIKEKITSASTSACALKVSSIPLVVFSPEKYGKVATGKKKIINGAFRRLTVHSCRKLDLLPGTKKIGLPDLWKVSLALLCVPLDQLKVRLARTSLCTAAADAQYRHAKPLPSPVRESPVQLSVLRVQRQEIIYADFRKIKKLP